MAIIFQTTLNKFYAAWNCIHLQFLMNDLDDAPNAKWFTSYLADPDDNRLTTKNEPYHPASETESFQRDVSRVVRRMVSTKVPTLVAEEEDTTIIKAVKLMYGTVTHDGESVPCNTTEDVTDETEVFYVLNAKLEQEELNYLNGTAPVLLQSRLSKSVLYKGQHDFIYLLGAGKVILTFYNLSGAAQTPVEFDFSDSSNDEKVKIIDICPSLHGFSIDLISRVTISILTALDVDNGTYDVYFYNTCEEDSRVGIIYLDRYGGRLALPKIEFEKIDTIRKSDEAYQYFNCELVVPISSGGLSSINVNNRRKLQLNIKMTNTVENANLLERFIASPGFHIQSGLGSDAKLIKYTLDNSNYTLGKKNAPVELQFTLTRAEEIAAQMQDA